MPAGMCLRSNWDASHIADPRRELTLDVYCQQNGSHVGKPIPLDRFIGYGHWYQQRAVPDVERKGVCSVDTDEKGFEIVLDGGGSFISKRVVVAAGIGAFAVRPLEFNHIPSALASHSSENKDLQKFKRQKIVVIGAGQSALESAALCKEGGAEVEVIARCNSLNWVGVHPRLHHLGVLSTMLYSNRDVGPAGLSRLVAMPYLFRQLPRPLQERIAYRSIRPAGSGWLRPRLTGVHITLGRKVIHAEPTTSQLRLRLDDGTERLVDYALLATGFRVDISRYEFLSPAILKQLETTDGFPVLKPGLESSIPGLHFVGKPAAWSFGPLLGFVSGTEFASNELIRSIAPHRHSGF